MRRCRGTVGMLCVLGLLVVDLPAAARSDATAPKQDAASSRAAASRAWLATIRPSTALQALLDTAVAEIARNDPKLLSSSARIAVIDLAPAGEPRLAHVRGDERVYPASVIKFVYLMAAYAWRERGRIAFDDELDANLTAMIHHSSNQATQYVFRRLTGTTAGPELDDAGYAAFRERRLVVEQWLESLGIDDLHAVNPTYDGGGDLFGRDQQFLRDRSIRGGLPAHDGQYTNRNAMTASGTVRLLALLATDRALDADSSADVRRRMRRDVREQPYLAHRIAGGAQAAGAEAFSKSGTWGPIYADAGIVRAPDGRQFVLAVFTDASPPYRGDAIARLTRRLADHLFPTTTPGGST